jgi:Popeye protein conserved region
MAASYLDYFIHAANILLLAAYSVRDILWLRVLAVASSLAAIPYFLLQPTPLWAAFGWSVLFTGINIFQTWRLVVERRPVKLTAEEEEVRRLVFRDLPPKKTLQVIGVGTWRSASPGEQLLERGKPLESIALIVRGKVQVMQNRRLLGELGPGAIVGSALLLSGARSDVDAVSTEVTRTLRWDAATLVRYLDANPETRNLFQRHLARDLAGKLERLGSEVTGTGG